MLLVRNRAALVIMNDCKYTSSQVTWKEHTMPRFHRVLSPFFSLHPYARFFRRGNPGEEGRFRIRSIPCRFPHLFPASVIRANFHRYRHRFSRRSGNRPPLFLPSIHAIWTGDEVAAFSSKFRFAFRSSLFEFEEGREGWRRVQVVHAECFSDRFVWKREGDEWHESRARGRELIFARVVFLLRGRKGWIFAIIPPAGWLSASINFIGSDGLDELEGGES